MVSQMFIDMTHNLNDFTTNIATFAQISPSTLALFFTAKHRFLILGVSGIGNFEFSQ